MHTQQSLGDYLRQACKRKGVSLSQASRDMGKSRNWLETIINARVRRPRVENCRVIAAYFNEDVNKILQLAGYIAASPPPDTVVDEISRIAHLLPRNDKAALLEYAQLLQLRITVEEERFVQFPDVGIDWSGLSPQLARNLASFVDEYPQTATIWIEALQSLPEKAVECLLLTIQHYDDMSGRCFEIGPKIARRLAAAV